MFAPTVGFAGQQSDDVCSNGINYAHGSYLEHITNGERISVLDEGQWKPTDFVSYKNAILDQPVKGDAVVVAYHRVSEAGDPILCILRRIPQQNLEPQNHAGKNEFQAVADLVIPASKWESIQSEIKMNSGAERDIHSFGTYSSGPYSRSPGSSSSGNQTSHEEAEGTVTGIKMLSPYEYEIELEPLRTQDVKAVEGSFFCDLSTSIGARLQAGARVRIEFRLGEHGRKIAIAVHAIRNPQ